VLYRLDYSKSSGEIRLKSNDPFTHPHIDPKYYSDKSDADTMLRGAQAMRKLAAAPQLAKYARQGDYPRRHKFVDASLDVNSDDYLRQLMKYMTKTLYHPMGTAKMGPSSDPMAVVSPTLEVHGIQGLRVVDLSVTPGVRVQQLFSVVYHVGFTVYSLSVLYHSDHFWKHQRSGDYDR
jgi:choline dehydrogenase